ncbi:MAG: TlpA family protein disulfide reductase [Luteibaculaceae bacterium]
MLPALRSLIVVFVCIALNSSLLAQMPSVIIKDINGKPVDTKTIMENDGNPVVINFWATWCAPCKRELNTIAELYDDWVEETGVKIYAVSIDDSRQVHKVAPFVNGSGWEYEILLDTNHDLKRALNVNNVPHTFLFNGKGELVYQHNNYAPGDEDDLYEKILKAANK